MECKLNLSGGRTSGKAHPLQPHCPFAFVSCHFSSLVLFPNYTRGLLVLFSEQNKGGHKLWHPPHLCPSRVTVLVTALSTNVSALSGRRGTVGHCAQTLVLSQRSCVICSLDSLCISGRLIFGFLGLEPVVLRPWLHQSLFLFSHERYCCHCFFASIHSFTAAD